MAAPRLPFLWPMLWKPQLAPQIRSHARAPRSKRSVSTTSFRSVEAPIQRYGKAHEPAPHLREQLNAERTDPAPPKIPHDPAKDVEEEDDEPDPHVPTEPPATPAKTPSNVEEPPDTPAPAPPSPPSQDAAAAAKPLDSVLHMPGPSDESHKPPHLKTPPYVHHFDTYGLVRQLSLSTYTPSQSITLMKAVRGLLITNMTLAREGLVSKSNVENETYLFRAACAELKTEIGNARRAEVERMRTERGQLQHEVDILGQKLGQETGAVKDELKGLFDDRRMAVRQEQRGMETKIQELNNQITIALNSDARSEVEGLRWVLTRRIAMGIATMATMVILLLQVNSSRKHEQKEEQKKKKKNDDDDGASRSLLPPVDEPQRLGLSNITSVATTGQEEALGGELLATEGVSLG